MDNRALEQILSVLPMECVFNTSILDNLDPDENDLSEINQPQASPIEDNYKEDDDNYTFIKDEVSKITELDDCPDSDKSVLTNAFYEAYRSKRLTPLLKYELKCLIQARRLTQGMDEMKVQFLDPTVQQLSDVEQHKVDRRRSQNRLAARRFRQKRKMSEEVLLQAIHNLQEQNQGLQVTVQVLRKEKQLLMETVTDHLLHCPCLSQLPLETPNTANVP